MKIEVPQFTPESLETTRKAFSLLMDCLLNSDNDDDYIMVCTAFAGMLGIHPKAADMMLGAYARYLASRK